MVSLMLEAQLTNKANLAEKAKEIEEGRRGQADQSSCIAIYSNDFEIWSYKDVTLLAYL